MSRAELEAFADEVGASGPVTAVGGRTQWEVGGLPTPESREVRAPAGIVSFDPAEMTVRVRAGTPVSELAAELATAGQRVLLPEPGAGATVGGVLSVGVSDVRRLRYGPLRDVLLEARFVSSSGSIVKAGGPTVKNVTGFDLCRVLVGSLGTLGLLAEVVLRTRPVSPASCWLRAAAEPEAAMEVLWRPAAVLADGASTWVLLEGHAVDVAAERDALARLGFEEVDGPPELPPHRWSVPPAEWRRHVSPGRVIAEVGVGTLHADHPQPSRALDRRVIELHRQLKTRFDPAGRLNPGRDVLWGAAPR